MYTGSYILNLEIEIVNKKYEISFGCKEGD
jgi:hypothetical protein